MGFNMKSWNNPITLDSNNLNRIEQGIKNAHDTLEITNEEVSNLQNKQAQIIRDINTLTKDTPNIIETLNKVTGLLENNDISAILSSADTFLTKTKQTLSEEELKQVHKNLGLNSFLKLTSIKVNGVDVVSGSRVNITLPTIDTALNINSTNAISNNAVTKALQNFNLNDKIPTKLSDLEQEDNYRTVTTQEINVWNSILSYLEDINKEESDPTVPSWAKTKNKPSYYYSEILNAPTVPTNISELTNDTNYITSETAIETINTQITNSLNTFDSTKVIPLNNRVVSIEGQLPVITQLIDSHTHQDIIDTSKNYTDQKITTLYESLIGPGSTEAIDTIQELANAFKTNSDIIKTLNDAISTKLTGTKVHANNPDIFIGYNSTENKNSGYQVAFKGNDQAKGLCWSKFANMTNEPIAPSACTYNGFFYVSSTTNSLSGADANPFLQYHTANSDFRILTTAYSDIWLQQIATDFISSHVYTRRKENGTWSDWVKLSKLSNKDVGALPDYTITISHQSAGNPRLVKFVSVNYASRATCFKMAAMTCHDNGVSYQFLTDMLIAVTTAGQVTANIYKFAQQEVGSVDGVTRYTGDVFYVNDTTNKIVDFYILCGQWSNSQFTPVTRVGSTTIDYVTQYSGNAIYYSSGTKTWVNGCGTTYAKLSDIPTNYVTTNTEQTVSSKKIFTGTVDIRGTAASMPIKTRGIVGSDGNGAVGDLYLQYGTTYAIYFGSTGQSRLLNNGGIYLNDWTINRNSNGDLVFSC